MIECGFAGWRIIHAGDALGEKIRAAQVRSDEFVEALFAGLKDIGANAGRDSGIVDQNVQPSELGFDGR